MLKFQYVLAIAFVKENHTHTHTHTRMHTRMHTLSQCGYLSSTNRVKSMCPGSLDFSLDVK